MKAIAVCLGFILGLAVRAQQPEFISPALVTAAEQQWGELGFDRAAHAPGVEGQPLRIADKTYARGLGHHANGSIVLALDGQYSAFQAEVGLQPCAGGSVVFRVQVDGQLRFESGIVRSGEAPRPVRVDVEAAQELQLEALDAGDGITCDMANWADARLLPAPAPASARAGVPSVDIAPFGRAVTWDPNRSFGARAGRIEEFRADDLFTETNLMARSDGAISVPVYPALSNSLACVGLQWLEERRLRELGLEFIDSPAPPVESVRVEGWLGESAWQGGWKPLAGKLQAENRTLRFLPAGPSRARSRKVRWVFPAAAGPAYVRLSAFSSSRWATTNLVVQSGRPKAGGKGTLTIYNGRLPAAPPQAGAPDRLAWTLSQPLHFPVVYSRSSLAGADPTVLRFRLPHGAVAVAVRDVLSNDCVYLPDFGLFVAREPQPVTLEDYRARIAGRKTILEEVREMPEQTLSRAMARTHHDFQREGPVMLSLACDNNKWVVERDGVVRFQPEPFDWSQPWQKWNDTACQLRPRFGTGAAGSLTRKLDGGWLPVPAISVLESGIRYSERAMVAPLGKGAPAGLEPEDSVCLVEFTAANEQSSPANATLTLSLTRRSESAGTVEWASEPGRLVASLSGKPIAMFEPATAADVQSTAPAGTVAWTRRLAPGEQVAWRVWLPAAGVPLAQLPAGTAAEEIRNRTGQYWTSVLSPAMQVATPDEWLNQVIRSSQVRCLIAARNEAHGLRIAPSIAAMSYGPLESEANSVIRGMDFMGHADFARRSLDFFIHRYNTNGFLTTGYTTFGTAWHLWSAGEHYQLTRDTNWLRAAAPELARVCRWVLRQTDKTKQLDGVGKPRPEFGLMPPGVLADWNAFAFHFAMNGYYYAGLRASGLALREIHYPEAELFLRRADELRRDTLRAYAWTQAQSPALPLRNGTWIPPYPSQVHSPGPLSEFFPGQDAGRSWCYDVELGAHQLAPAGVLDPRSREVARMMDHMEDAQFLADGWFDYPAVTNRADWFDLGGFSKVQPYYTRNCEIYALRDDVKPFIRSYFNTLAAMLNPEVLTFWEHFHHSGAWDKTHETGYFLHQTRTMLIEERGRELWLAPFIPSAWLEDGKQVLVRNAPTRFGPVSYEIASHAARGYVEAHIDPPLARPPAALVLRLRLPEGRALRAVALNGKRHRSYDAGKGEVRLSPSNSTLNLRVEF